MSPPSQRPPIAIACTSEESAALCLASVERGGGAPNLLTTDRSTRWKRTIRSVGGLIVYGAAEGQPVSIDVSVGREAEPKSVPTMDTAAMPLLEAALERDLPVLAIGSGMHVLNTALGGKPSRVVAGHDVVESEGALASSYHRIYIAPGSKLAAVVGCGGFVRINSRHETGVTEARKSTSLLASAYSLEDGVIEALESPDHRWVIGVQFHPERAMELPPHFLRLFESLVDRAGEYLAAGKLS